jgi:hypothetical protein
MIQIRPVTSETLKCDCGGELIFTEYLWQGLHVARKFICSRCNERILESLPVNQSYLEQYRYYENTHVIKNAANETVDKNWFSEKLICITSPKEDKVEFDITVFKKYDDVIILNTIDYVYGHSLLYLMNLQRLLEHHGTLGIIVLIQPMFRWMIRPEGIAEIWTVKLGFSEFNFFHSDLSDKINKQLERFNNVFLSKGHIIPTNEKIWIEKFTGIKPYNFEAEPPVPAITFIWREDLDRLWIRNFYILKGCKKLGLSKILLPFHYLRVLFLFRLLKKKTEKKYKLAIAGLGRFGRMPSYIEDHRIKSFNDASEKELCTLYSKSILVLGVHGSSMILPTAHSGMSVSLMPSKRWGNFAEDVIFTEHDVRIASFQRRILPLNLSLFDLKDIVVDMISGRDYFIKKFVHSDEL